MALTAKKVYAILKRQISDMEAKLNSPVRYKGTVATADLLPLNPDIGDMYNIESKSIYGEAGMNVAWNGAVWDTMGAPIDMSLYFTKEETETVIQRLVTEYFEKNPVKPGATAEQAQQIEQNKTDIVSLKTETGSLKEDISNKITKFYASNQGKTHLADSDNGKIQGMMIYGKSSQDGVPTPENPVEIKSVVNPTVKMCGKNLLDVNLAKANNNVKIHNGVVEQIDSDTRVELQWKIIQIKSNGTIINYNEVSIMQGTRFGCAFTAVENTTEIVFGLNGEKVDTTVRISVKLKVGQKYVISCNLLNSTQGSIKWDEMMLEEGSTITDFEPYHEQTVTLPYTLNAIPVSSGGNVTIDGQQYIADYVDVERGKLVRMVDSSKLDNTQSIIDKTEWLLAEPQEIDLTQEEVQTLKTLATYYPTTNISINSEQLYGYTVFNYPISMENDWNYVKQQISDMREELKKKANGQGITLSINESGGLRVTYDDGK